MNSLYAFLAKGLASGLYLSYLPARLFQKRRYTGAGLVGSILGVAALPILPRNFVQEAAVLAGVFFMAVVVSDAAEMLMERKDDPRIVIDEFLGVWLAAAFLPRTFTVVFAAFILFRCFDVMKPLGIRRWGNLPGGWGVVLDDVLAGCYANVLLQIAEKIHPF